MMKCPPGYPARPKGAKPDEKKDSGTAPEQPAKKKKEDNPLLMKTGTMMTRTAIYQLGINQPC